MKAELFEACDRTLFSAATGVYQGILIVILVGFSLRMLRRTNAATRHAVWLITLGLVVSLIPAHWLRDYRAHGKAAPGFESPVTIGNHDTLAPASGEGRPGPQRASTPGVLTRPDVLEPLKSGSPALAPFEEGPFSTGQTLAYLPLAGAVVLDPLAPGLLPELSAAHTEYAPAGAAFMGGAAPKSRRLESWLLHPLAWSVAPSPALLRITSMAALGGWFIVALFRFGFLLMRLAAVRRLKAQATPSPAGMAELFERLLRQLAIKRNVELKVSALQRSPVLLGFLHPVVLIPQDQAAAAEQLEPILRHELAHVRRRDDWVNLGQRFIQAILFFHPAIWWICRQLSIEREIACDDHVLQQGSRARAYALLLADFANRFQKCRPLLAPGVSTSKSHLQKRIDMILNTKRNSSPHLAKTRLGLITSAAALLAVLAIYAAPRVVLAENGSPAPVAGTPSTPSLPPVGMAAPAATAPQSPAPPALPATNPGEDVLQMPAVIEVGPKIKTGKDLYVPATPVPPAPAVLAAPAPAGAPYVVAIPRLAEAPKSVDSADTDASMEERLRRLEKMVDSLVKKQDRKEPPPGMFLWKGQPGQQAWIEPEKLKEIQDMAQREAARAAEQVKRAGAEAERARKLQQERAQAGSKTKNDFARQMESLEKQRGALEREVEKLQQQIQRLEQERDRLEQERDKLQDKEQRRSEIHEEDLLNSSERAVLELPRAENPGAASLPKK